MNNSGYEFEMGRIRAQREEQERLALQNQQSNTFDSINQFQKPNQFQQPHSNINYNSKNKWVALLLCISLGLLGVHRFLFSN